MHGKTLIELYDAKPMKNVLSTEVFRPDRTVYLCPPEVARNKALQEHLRAYFRHRGVPCRLIFEEASLLDAAAVRATLQQIVERYGDCVVDISGGTDAALFGAGMLGASGNLSVMTYSRKTNTFYAIQRADFAHEKVCSVALNVEDCFLMAGGSVRQGRVDNAILSRYRHLFDPFFEVYLQHRRNWIRIVTYIQRISQCAEGEAPDLWVEGGFLQKGERGSRISADESALRALERIGMLRELKIRKDSSVRFRFADAQVRAWLRDVGSVLELKTYQTCLDTGCFHDVRTSVIVDWNGVRKGDGVSNEIDVMATRGVIPVFISCKTGEVKTEALNELAILKDRFGGETARAAIVTATVGGTAMRGRAAELGIEVIDLNDLRSDGLPARIAALGR